MDKEKKGKAPPLFSWYVVFFPLFRLQWETGEKTAHTCLIPKDDRGFFFLYFIWGDLWIKTVAWLLVCDLSIKSRMKFLVGWYAGFLQITLSVLERKWKSLEILFCILSTNYMFYFFRNRYKSSEMKPRFKHDRGLTRELLRPIPQNKVLSALMRQWRNSWNSSKPNAWRLSLMCRLAGYRFQMSFIPLF